MSIYRRGAKGFTLVEIMIVVAIIALIAAIAIPNLLRARHNANETAAIGNMKTIVNGLESFRANQTPPGYPANLLVLSNANPQYIDSALSSGTRQGYGFNYAPGQAGPNGAVNTYTLVVTPSLPGTTGTRSFWANESGVIYVHPSGAPVGPPADPPLE